MSDSTTILLAVRKDKDLKKFFQEIGLPEDLPKNFLSFKDDEGEIKRLIEIQDMKLEFLLNKYDLFINTIFHMCENDVDLDFYDKAHDQMWNMIHNIEKESGEDIFVIFAGDMFQDGYLLKAPLMYSKEEIFGIFKSDDKDLIRSLIVNKIIEDMEFTEIDILKLRNALKFPLKNLIYSADFDFEVDLVRGIYFRDRFYKIFGKDYIKALLDLIILSTSGNVHISEKNVRKISNPYIYSSYIDEKMVINKIRSSLKELSFENNETSELFSESLRMISQYLGTQELIEYLNDTKYFDLLKSHHITQYPHNQIYEDISNAVLFLLESEDSKSQQFAINIHLKMMRLLKFFFEMNDSTQIVSDYIQCNMLSHILMPYVEKDRIDLILPHLRVIPAKNLNEYIHSKFRKEMKSKIFQALNQ